MGVYKSEVGLEYCKKQTHNIAIMYYETISYFMTEKLVKKL